MNMKKCKFCGEKYTIKEYEYIISCYKCNYFIYYFNEFNDKKISHIRVYFSKDLDIRYGLNVCLNYTYKIVIYEEISQECKCTEIPIPFIKFEEIEDLEAFKKRIMLYIKLI